MLKRLIKHILFISVVLGLVSCATAPDTEGDADQSRKQADIKVTPETNAAYQRALWALKSGRDDEALTLFKKVTAENPNLAGGFTNLGLLYLKAKNLPEAENAFKQAVTINPNNAVSYNHLGVVYRQTGKFEDARKAYEEALRLKEDYALAHLNLGILFDIYLQDLPQALNHYIRYKELNGQDEEVDKWITDLQRRVESNSKAAPQQEG